LGQEIERSHFRKQDFTDFGELLRQETALLKECFETQQFADQPLMGGFELEMWLIDQACQPLPENEKFLELLNNDMVFAELARFNIELNNTPEALSNNALRKMHKEVQRIWDQCAKTARKINGNILAIGILPTLKEPHLNLDNMSSMKRYRALNEQVRRMREGHPLELDINGREALKTYHENVMMESAATSFQLHLQVPQALAAQMFNTAIIISAPMVAISANSPYLFGHDLWDETRIPVFEQAVSVCMTDVCPDARVGFGNGYAKHSLMECFTENLERYPVLLPESMDDAPERFSHLRLHNGTIWRWNRPLVGFDEQGRPHLRIEHRVMASGPSLIDTVANAAFFYGLVQSLTRQSPAPETVIHFSQARRNFYLAAQKGLDARIRWTRGNEVCIHDLLLEELLPMAHKGLEQLGIANGDIKKYLGVIEGRLRKKQNGANWQRAFVKKNGKDMKTLTAAYLENQQSKQPVHEWKL